MRLHRLIRESINRAGALAAMACILLALAATAGAVPGENVGPRSPRRVPSRPPRSSRRPSCAPATAPTRSSSCSSASGPSWPCSGRATWALASQRERPTCGRPTSARADPPRSPSPAPPFPPFERGGRGDPARIDVPSQRPMTVATPVRTPPARITGWPRSKAGEATTWPPGAPPGPARGPLDPRPTAPSDNEEHSARHIHGADTHERLGAQTVSRTVSPTQQN